jgi:hypothetical protein
MQLLLPSEDIKFSDPADVGGGREAFQSPTLLVCCAAMGVPYTNRAFAITGERPVESRFEAVSGPTLLPLVGRDQELALLLERYYLHHCEYASI